MGVSVCEVVLVLVVSACFLLKPSVLGSRLECVCVVVCVEVYVGECCSLKCFVCSCGG